MGTRYRCSLPPCTSRKEFHKLICAHVEQLVQVHAAICELAEGTLLGTRIVRHIDAPSIYQLQWGALYSPYLLQQDNVQGGLQEGNACQYWGPRASLIGISSNAFRDADAYYFMGLIEVFTF